MANKVLILGLWRADKIKRGIMREMKMERMHPHMINRWARNRSDAEKGKLDENDEGQGVWVRQIKYYKMLDLLFQFWSGRLNIQ